MLNRGETGCIQPPCDEGISVQDGFTRLLSVAVKRDTHLVGEEGSRYIQSEGQSDSRLGLYGLFALFRRDFWMAGDTPVRRLSRKLTIQSEESCLV